MVAFIEIKASVEVVIMTKKGFSSERCVVVYTCRGKDRILAEGGSQAWRINKSRASKYQYVVCVQNRNETWGQATALHQEAFLIGKITAIEPSREKDNSDRAIIKFSEYAEISVPDSWDGNRNPVAYKHLSDFGIHDLEDLSFRRLAAPFSLEMIDEEAPVAPGDDYIAAAIDCITDDPALESSSKPQPLSIDEAKAGLALKFGVMPEQVDITIRF
ncbi:hypothetical protein [Pseudomonas oryzihabitans]|uniref:hypothetical protein n=1 Tax=Pseudomonas oryzihabitans TaxID=47885 RepID=UPI0030C3452F